MYTSIDLLFYADLALVMVVSLHFIVKLWNSRQVASVKKYDSALRMLEEEQGEWYVNWVLESALAPMLTHYAKQGPPADDESSDEGSSSSGTNSDDESNSDESSSDGSSGDGSSGDGSSDDESSTDKELYEEPDAKLTEIGVVDGVAPAIDEPKITDAAPKAIDADPKITEVDPKIVDADPKVIDDPKVTKKPATIIEEYHGC